MGGTIIMHSLKQLKEDIEFARRCEISPDFWPKQVQILKEASDRAIKANKLLEMTPEKLTRRFDI